MTGNVLSGGGGGGPVCVWRQGHKEISHPFWALKEKTSSSSSSSAAAAQRPKTKTKQKKMQPTYYGDTTTMMELPFSADVSRAPSFSWRRSLLAPHSNQRGPTKAIPIAFPGVNGFPVSLITRPRRGQQQQGRMGCKFYYSGPLPPP